MNKFPITEKCLGCKEIEAEGTCKSYLMPSALWRRGACPRATNLKKIVKLGVKLNPIKASRRGVKGV